MGGSGRSTTATHPSHLGRWTPVRFGSVRFGSVRFGSVRFGSVRSTGAVGNATGLSLRVCDGSGGGGCTRVGGVGWRAGYRQQEARLAAKQGASPSTAGGEGVARASAVRSRVRSASAKRSVTQEVRPRACPCASAGPLMCAHVVAVFESASDNALPAASHRESRCAWLACKRGQLHALTKDMPRKRRAARGGV